MRDSHTATLRSAIQNLCGKVKTRARRHVNDIHAYCAARLILEGGFPPECVLPRQRFASRKLNNAVCQLEVSPKLQGVSTRRVLGGIKDESVDVTVLVPGLGPVLGISSKRTANSFRNLTVRMEETLVRCTNVHLMYPGFVFGFLHLIRFGKVSEVGNPQDASCDERNQPLPAIRRYHEVLVALAGRNSITDPGMRYEAVGLLVYRCAKSGGEIWNDYPPKDSPVHFTNFFQRLYNLYDLRFGYPDPDGPNIRKAWRVSRKLFPSAYDSELPFPWKTRLAE